MAGTLAPTVPIYLDQDGVAWIDETNIKVIEVILDTVAFGWSPVEIHEQYPDLSLAQIHAALSYYHDHKQELDADLERRAQFVEAMRAQATPFPSRSELEKRRRAPGTQA